MKRLFQKIYKNQQTLKIQKNRKYLQQKQQKQLQFLKQYSQQIDLNLLNLSIQQLLTIKNIKTFYTFTTRCNYQKIKIINSLADINIPNNNNNTTINIPFTVKDHIQVKGLIDTLGYSHHIQSSTKSADVVQLLQKQGCIAYAHTNIPQGLLGIQSNNHVYGMSKNPYNPLFISGGSSGGAAAQVATRASVFAVASDTAGSVRIPASFCGTYSFKPTGSKRISNRGRVSITGQESIALADLDVSIGYITNRVDDLIWLCSKTMGKSIANTPYIMHKWNNIIHEQYKYKKLTIGYLIDNYQLQIASGIKNSLNEIIQILKQKGHTIISFKFNKLNNFRNYIFQMLKITNYIQNMIQNLSQQKQILQNQFLYDLISYGKLYLKYKKNKTKCKEEIQIYSNLQIQSTITNYMKLLKDKRILSDLFQAEWKQKNIDVLLSPVMPFTAPLQHNNNHLIQQLTYCCFQNVLELPAGTIPTRLVQQNQTIYHDTGFYGSQIINSIQNSQGLPIGIQVTGQHMKDQQCLAAMWQIQQSIHKTIHKPIQ